MKVSEPQIKNNVLENGIGVLTNVFPTSIINEVRESVLNNISLMKNTRPTTSSRHLAGFHRYPQLESLHGLITSKPEIMSCMRKLCGPGVRTIGLSDITVNRSQLWHKDLLRGQFSQYLNEDVIWSKNEGSVFKVILYLQKTASLKYVQGSHQKRISLADDRYAIPDNEELVKTISINPGDVVIMDVRLTHRGSDEEVFQSNEARRNPRILISTAFGTENCIFTDGMELGNAIRLVDWMQRCAD